MIHVRCPVSFTGKFVTLQRKLKLSTLAPCPELLKCAMQYIRKWGREKETSSWTCIQKHKGWLPSSIHNDKCWLQLPSYRVVIRWLLEEVNSTSRLHALWNIFLFILNRTLKFQCINMWLVMFHLRLRWLFTTLFSVKENAFHFAFFKITAIPPHTSSSLH